MALHVPSCLMQGGKPSILDLWKLADTASKMGGLEYGWQSKKCSVCGKLGCVLFSQPTGYRCEDHIS